MGGTSVATPLAMAAPAQRPVVISIIVFDSTASKNQVRQQNRIAPLREPGDHLVTKKC